MKFKPKENFCVSDEICFFKNKKYKVFESLEKGIWIDTENPKMKRYFGYKELYEKFKQVK